MLKKDSQVWKLAKRIARRKHCLWFPVALSTKPDTVIVQSLIRGTQWEKSLQSLQLLVD